MLKLFALAPAALNVEAVELLSSDVCYRSRPRQAVLQVVLVEIKIELVRSHCISTRRNVAVL